MTKINSKYKCNHSVSSCSSQSFCLLELVAEEEPEQLLFIDLAHSVPGQRCIEYNEAAWGLVGGEVGETVGVQPLLEGAVRDLARCTLAGEHKGSDDLPLYLQVCMCRQGQGRGWSTRRAAQLCACRGARQHRGRSSTLQVPRVLLPIQSLPAHIRH